MQPPTGSYCLLSLAAVQVNKDDLLSMVRYGAELVFSSEATNITGAAGWLRVVCCSLRAEHACRTRVQVCPGTGQAGQCPGRVQCH